MTYKYRAYKYPVPAQTVGEELERIESVHGELTKEIVLDEARSVKSILHPCFEWDDTIAAEKFRKEQARLLISSIVIVREDAEDTEVRAFLDVGDRSQGRFLNITAVMQDDDCRHTVLQKAKDELKQIKRKYATLKELAEVFTAIDRL